ncbi:MAG: UDP-N-acetylmuramoyl-L-alanyl-D-glutamate--2,6-diaminopimelate ligase [Balneolales bacterium]
MNFNKLISLCNPVAVRGNSPDHLGNLVLDSRKIEPGDVFIAIKGTRSNGHQFISQIADKGASAAIVEEFDHDTDLVQIKVENTRELLGKLAQEFEGNPGRDLKIAGITGTNGKTTVATLVYQVLRHCNKPAALLGTVATIINGKKHTSRLTTPDAIELAEIFREVADAGCDFAVMEASSHALDQQRTSGFDFSVAGFTNLSHDHLDYHHTLDAYATAKKTLFDNLKEGSKAFVNTDDSQGEFMIRDCMAEVKEYGFFNNQGDKIHQNNSDGLLIEVDGIHIHSPLIGDFNAYNLALAYYICRALGCSENGVVSALAKAPGAPGRMEKVLYDSPVSLPVVLVDYAHTPDALKNVLKTLQDVKKAGETVHVLFGAGGDRDITKRAVMAKYAEEFADFITVSSDNPRSEEPEAIIDDVFKGFSQTRKVIREADRKEAIIKTVARADSKSIILIAGKGHETHQEVKGVYHHFDDKAIALKALQDLEKKYDQVGGVQ